ncbi:MAG: hypothetical protein ABIA78_03435 [archaeon]
MVYGFRFIGKEVYYSQWGCEFVEEVRKSLEDIMRIFGEGKGEIFEKKGINIKTVITTTQVQKESPEFF